MGVNGLWLVLYHLPKPQNQVCPLARTFLLSLLSFIILVIAESIVVQCSQTGKEHTVKVKSLTTDSCDPVMEEDLKKGNSLIMEFQGKPYPVQFIRKAGMCRQSAYMCVHIDL